MTIRNFDNLLKPASVALVGASIKAGSVGSIVARNLLQDGFKGPVWFVNPKYQAIADHPCYPSVAALPHAPDLAVLVTPPPTIPALIERTRRQRHARRSRHHRWYPRRPETGDAQCGPTVHPARSGPELRWSHATPHRPERQFLACAAGRRHRLRSRSRGP